jgi:anti-anti-sigma factor
MNPLPLSRSDHAAGRPVDDTLDVRYQPAADAAPIVVDAHGELDCSTAPPLQERLLQLIDERGARSIVLDMEAVRFMDSSGLHALVQVHKMLVSKGGELVLQRPTNIVRKVLELTGMDQVLSVVGP